MTLIRWTAMLSLPVLVVLGLLLVLDQETGRANPGPGRFDRFTLHNLTNENAPVAVKLTRGEGDPVVIPFAVEAGKVGGHVLLKNESAWDVTKAECTVRKQSVTITAETDKHIEWATFYLGKDEADETKLCGHALQSDGKILLSGPMQ